MSIVHMEYFSDALQGRARFNAILPDMQSAPDWLKGTSYYENYQRPPKVIVMLHGYTGGESDVLLQTRMNEYVGKYNLCVISPAGGNFFYVDCPWSGGKYATFVAVELMEKFRRTFRIETNSENTIISGWSMGGFGAVYLGWKYPEVFSKIVAFAPALLTKNLEAWIPMDHDRNEAYYRMIFGDITTASERDVNPEVLAKELAARNHPVPPVYVACGQEDFLLGNNLEFVEFLKAQGIGHEFHTGPGVHSLEFWNQYMEDAIQWAVGAPRAAHS